MVRAVQGHSIAQVDADQGLERLEPHTMPQTGITYKQGAGWCPKSSTVTCVPPCLTLTTGRTS